MFISSNFLVEGTIKLFEQESRNPKTDEITDHNEWSTFKPGWIFFRKDKLFSA